MPLAGATEHRLDLTKKLFDDLPAGLTYLIAHPATDTPELRSIAGDWRHRVADFATLGDPSLTQHLRRRGVHVVGWRPFREQLRTGAASVMADDT
jgi:hypothetical protein